MTLEMTERENILMEACIRIVTCDLLDKDEDMVEIFTAVLSNLSNGSFTDKGYQFEDPNDYESCIEDLKQLIDKLNPTWKKLKDKVKKESDLYSC